uniref:Uncharacterized protein n=1 Tax=Rhizophagus irregularis (strain DAOM 181602 / DAOM 197198 / MUCL 43194) TaxID=747089 RepID=U9UH19_RHIID
MKNFIRKNDPFTDPFTENIEYKNGLTCFTGHLLTFPIYKSGPSSSLEEVPSGRFISSLRVLQ